MGSPAATAARFAAQVENYLELLAFGETHDDMLRLRLGRISVKTLERIRKAAKALRQRQEVTA